MHNHFDKHLNLKALILEKRPSLIVECGAGNGDLTSKIASLLDVYDFEFHVISDNRVENLDPRIISHNGLSYEALESFIDGTIGLCIIDTDHNYWTLMKELSILCDRLKEGGFIALHDVATFYHNTGMALSYWDDKPYPREEIEKFSPYGSLGDAVVDFLQLKKTQFKMHAWNPECNGAALIQKSYEPIFSIVTPGPAAIFVKKETKNAMLQVS